MKKLLIALTLLFPFTLTAGDLLPRNIAAFYDSVIDKDPRNSYTHINLERPLNHNGFKAVYYDINAELPPLDETYHGIILSFTDGVKTPNPKALFKWAIAQVDAGKKIILFGNLGLDKDFRSDAETFTLYNALLRKVGVEDQNLSIEFTFKSETVSKDRSYFDFEKVLSTPFPNYKHVKAIDVLAKSLLKIKNGENISDLVVMNRNGAFVAKDFAIYEDEKTGVKNWFINPFKFFDDVFESTSFPKPDTTTINGKRIFYMLVDGDGWNLPTDIDNFKTNIFVPLSSQVVHENIIKKNPDFPFTVSLIGAELDTSCFGTKEGVDIANKIFLEQNVELASHSYSHPLHWDYYKDKFDEEKYKKSYPPKPEDAKKSLISKLFSRKFDYRTLYLVNPGKSKTALPRSYICSEYSLEKEIKANSVLLESMISAGKKTELVSWSGNMQPSAEVLQKANESGLLNINGGTSFFDKGYKSYIWVPPIGIVLNNNTQIYSANINESSFADAYNEKVLGIENFTEATKWAGDKIRIAPVSLYYHIHVGQKKSSMNAVDTALEYARNADLNRIKTSDYAKIANGFYNAQIKKLDNDKWQILNRGSLDTIRFDNPQNRMVDFNCSRGVIGQNIYTNSLYVDLDKEQKEPVICLSSPSGAGTMPHIVASNWKVSGFSSDSEQIVFNASGYGAAKIEIKLPQPPKKLEVFTLDTNNNLLTFKDFIIKNQNIVELMPKINTYGEATFVIRPEN